MQLEFRSEVFVEHDLLMNYIRVSFISMGVEVSAMAWHAANLGASCPFPGSFASGWT